VQGPVPNSWAVPIPKRTKNESSRKIRQQMILRKYLSMGCPSCSKCTSPKQSAVSPHLLPQGSIFSESLMSESVCVSRLITCHRNKNTNWAMSVPFSSLYWLNSNKFRGQSLNTLVLNLIFPFFGIILYFKFFNLKFFVVTWLFCLYYIPKWAKRLLWWVGGV
jgi:hypothetical protein